IDGGHAAVVGMRGVEQAVAERRARIHREQDAQRRLARVRRQPRLLAVRVASRLGPPACAALSGAAAGAAHPRPRAAPPVASPAATQVGVATTTVGSIAAAPRASRLLVKRARAIDGARLSARTAVAWPPAAAATGGSLASRYGGFSLDGL